MELGTGTSRIGMKEGDTVNGSIMVGESLAVLNDILPCQEVVDRIIQEARETLARARDIEL